MHVVALVVAAYGVHVRVKPFAALETVAFQRHALPFCERMDDLRRPAALLQHVETDRALHTVEVVVDARARRDEKGRGHALETEVAHKIALERVLDELDRLLRLADAHARLVVFGYLQVVHILSFMP